jgi:hypothetical protein
VAEATGKYASAVKDGYFELSDKTDSKTNFEQAIRGSVRRASGLVLVNNSENCLEVE